ncbi:probable calcium-binding protein CML46 [Miscanthus floridulus]|uniref:probable calcium-binding protein CML46 n=1 Tax=Miscanthus floridulus TaxID=154761 RepID=UPI00345B14EA
MPELSYLFNTEQPTIEEVRHVFDVAIAAGMPELSLSGLFNTEEPTLDDARRAFAVFDVNRDGFIDAADLQVVLARLGIPQDATVCRAMIVAAGRGNWDGRMNLTQLITFLCNGLSVEPLPRRN